MSGPRLNRQLIKSGEQNTTIFVTAYPDEAARKRALQAGVQCYLTKPFREGDLLECVRLALESAA